jgi:hypothetical protein
MLAREETYVRLGIEANGALLVRIIVIVGRLRFAVYVVERCLSPHQLLHLLQRMLLQRLQLLL